MRKPSSASAKIHWFESQKAMESLKTAARQMKARYPEIDRVLLFGSRARGEAVPGSDADLPLSCPLLMDPSWSASRSICRWDCR